MWSRSPPTHLVGLFAQLRFDPELLVLGVLLIVLIVAGCIAVARVRRWRQEDAAPVTLEEQIKSYGELVERGELAPQEFERIKARLEQKAADVPPDTRIQGPVESRPSQPPPAPDTRIQVPADSTAIKPPPQAPPAV
jgi:hypothetical protein